MEAAAEPASAPPIIKKTIAAMKKPIGHHSDSGDTREGGDPSIPMLRRRDSVVFASWKERKKRREKRRKK